MYATRRWTLVTLVTLVTVVVWYAVAMAIVRASSIAGELDKARALAELSPRPQATVVFDRFDRPAFTFFVEQRIDVPIDRISRHMIEAIVAVEDRRFFSHHGIDPIRIAGAAWRNYMAGRIVQGGSTITQQLARAARLSPARTYDRKLREIMIAAQLEARHTKEQILESYLNTVYFGEGLYGVEAAARGYFHKSASGLEPHEAALLAALVRSPSVDAPRVAPERALARRNLVLRLMREQGRLSEEQFRTASATGLPPRVGSHNVLATNAQSPGGEYYQEEVRRQLVALFGGERVLRGGLRVYTAYDPALQREAEKAVRTRIAQIAKVRRAARDLQGSLVAMDPLTGDVLALVGGRDFAASSFNRATQARRQAGSAFKPILYAAALERGFAPGTILKDLDVPIEYGAREAWLPSGDHERSEYTLRRALKVSSNRAAAQLLQQVGLSTTVYYAQRLGIQSELPMVPSLALGTGEVTLLELTTAYTAFANHGMMAAPRLITRVEDPDGTLVYSGAERHTQAISRTTAYLMSSMLSDVVSSGTGARARIAGFKLPAAGKTGTTDDFADAWFVGYTPRIVTGIWFGLDKPAPIMRDGLAGKVAVPAWAQFMRAATAGAKPEWFDMPSDVEKLAICRISGARATASCRHAYVPQPAAYSPASSLDGSYPPVDVTPVRPLPPAQPNVYEDLFPIGSVSSEQCPVHSPSGYGLDGGTTGTPGDTPLVDAALRGPAPAPRTAQPIAVTSPAARSNARYVVEHVVGEDGKTRVVIKRYER
jgi:penicillin-binding protein 1A